MPNIFEKLREAWINTTDPKKVAESLWVDYIEVINWTKRVTEDVLEQSKILKTTNTFSKPWMTQRDIEVMEKIKSKDEKEFNRLMNMLEYHDEYIQITLPKSWTLKIDREDLWRMPWQEGMDKAKSLWKRLMTIEELEELANFTLLENCREIFSLEATSYWSSTTIASFTSNARYLFFYNANTSNNNKTVTNRVICTR